MVEAVLNSNRGSDSLTLELGDRFDWQGEAGVEAVLRLDGQHFDGDHERELRLVVEGFCLRAKALSVLHREVREWLSLPLGQLAVSPLRGTHVLCLNPHQRLDLVFGERHDTIAERHPVVTIAYRAGKLEGEYHFVTDQSCLRLFAESLGRPLSEASLNNAINPTGTGGPALK